ncbi:MAG: type III ribulose-bisphosphate carboxylase [Candidatus Micrarchaeota archaeon]|nr:type III ribulose-bisphosphate carboxylase [Candidatus Micrarchaeota archaeon]
MDFVDLRYKPEKNGDVVTTVYVESKDLKKAANEIAAESSVGTWTKISTMKERVMRNLAARVFSIRKEGGGAVMKIAYPVELFEDGNVPQILSDIAGNIFGMKGVDNLRLLDFEIPDKYARSFKGPEFGMEGVRRIMGTSKNRRPHIGTIVKPKVGLNPKETAKVAYDAWAGGIDFVKDDENLTSQTFCKFEERIARVLEAKEKAESETGKKKMYAANITASSEVMLGRAEFVKAHGGNCIMVDIITAGFSGLQFIRNQKLGMVIHGHRAMYAAFARNKRHGIAMLPLAKLARMAGVDQLHIGAVVGKMEGGRGEVLGIHKTINGKWAGLKPVFSVCSGGLAPENVPDLVRIFGNDIVIQAGGGVHGHPNGTRAGATALLQAVEAAVRGIPLDKYAKTHEELRLSPAKWSLGKQYSHRTKIV